MGKTLFVCALALAACGGDDGNTDTKKDAAGSGSGSNTNSVSVVACTGTPPTVSGDPANTMKYIYSTGATAPTITAGSMVEFKMTPNHNVAPSLTGNTDPGLKVDYSADVCLKFSKAGTFNFVCTTHGFSGQVIVN